MKFKFSKEVNRAIEINKPRDIGSCINTFVDAYKNYRTIRELAHTKINGKDGEEMNKSREDIFKATFTLYEVSASMAEFKAHFENVLKVLSNSQSEQEVNDYITSAFIYPYSITKNRSHSPIEAIYATCNNIEIINEFFDASQKNTDSILLSGSSAWGPFYAVSGKLPESIVSLGMEQRGLKEMSDVDFLMVLNDINQMERLVDSLIDKKLLNETEKQRFKKFKMLYEGNSAEVFSIRGNYKGTEESLHLLLGSSLERIAYSLEEKTVDQLGYLKDFRPDLGSSLHGGYPIKDLLGLTSITFVPSIYQVKEGDIELGYISQISTGGFTDIKGHKTYLIGILGFFLLITPVVLHDKDSNLSKNIMVLKNNVREVLNNQEPVYIPREERMPSVVLHAIKSDLIKS